MGLAMQAAPQKLNPNGPPTTKGVAAEKLTAQEISATGDPFPIRLLVVALALTALLLGWLAWKALAPAASTAPLQQPDWLWGTGLLSVLSLCAWLVVIRDIQRWRRTLIQTLADEKAAQEALRESRAFYASLVDVLPQSIFRKDLQGRFTFGNKKFCAMLRKPLEEIVGKTDLDFFPAEFAEKYRKDDQAVISSGKVFETVEEHLTPQGTRLFVNVVKTPIYDSRWKIIGIQAIFWDVTERKLAEEALAQKADELARSNAELEQFAYVASQDLQEPLRMVASYTQLLARRYREKLEGDALEFIQYAVDGANRMQQLINDLLAYSRVGSKGQEFASVDCTSVLGQTIANLRERIEETGAIVTNDDLPTVQGDATQLAQLFQNLISNALKFRGSEAPQVHVSASQRNRSTAGPEAEWLFSVRDNGIGIDPQFSERIFVIFQRLHTQAQYPGTGIGLAICRKIVERHGGRIWVESQLGQGATFFFTLPTNPQANEESSTQRQTHRNPSG
ncbi:MAG: PAS domain S-box protein [Verrucomicrobia bacterium]|nr:PAS domain S-box protein [Verrucomicrobiota bacterium]